jgi:hypothetical protein
MATAVPAIAARVTTAAAANAAGWWISIDAPKNTRATSHDSPNETTPSMIVTRMRPKMTTPKFDGAATSISSVPCQRSPLTIHPALKSTSHQSAMNTGAIAA